MASGRGEYLQPQNLVVARSNAISEDPDVFDVLLVLEGECLIVLHVFVDSFVRASNLLTKRIFPAILGRFILVVLNLRLEGFTGDSELCGLTGAFIFNGDHLGVEGVVLPLQPFELVPQWRLPRRLFKFFVHLLKSLEALRGL